MNTNAVESAVMRRWRIALILAACFLFRLFFGLSREFFFEDETQIFLLGFRYHATGAWPFFGPDVVWTRSEIPGALQALLVGLPLRVLAIPESPFVLLNLLSFAATCALAWYACAQLPQAPRWLIWGWFLTIPWTLQFSTHMINTSYILAPAIVFFIGFFEATPAFSLRRLPPAAAFAMMGLAIVWLMQIHMSWPLLIPFAAGAWISRRADGPRALAIDAAAFAAGALIPGALLLPTLARYGLHAGSGGVLRNLHPHWVNPWIIVTTLARFLSFASLEISRFIATDGAKRLEFFGRHLWLAPAAIVVGVIGVVQPLWMFVDGCRPMRQWPAAMPRLKWAALRRLVAASVLLVYASYWFVMEPPQAHAFYVLAPIAFVFAAFWWTFVDSPRARQIAAGVLIAQRRLPRRAGVGAGAGAVALQEPRGGRDGGAPEGAGDVRAPARLRDRRRTGRARGPVAPLRSDARFPGARVGVPAGAAAVAALDDHRSQPQRGRRLPRSAVCRDLPGRARRRRRASGTSGSRTSSSRATRGRSSSTTASPARRSRRRGCRSSPPKRCCQLRPKLRRH